ncbi:MAG TPA: NAD(+)/NADH kinase [Verrucomicrobiae bacterium]|nr:NAD(+)/NADH kinase [Verrucomicrobiae bacterium]
MKKQADKLRRIGITGNSEKAACADLVRQAARRILGAGRELFCEQATAAWSGTHARTCPDVRTLAQTVDLLLVFGGDGTILRVARAIAGSQTPILGINIGSLGFLTAVPSDQLVPALRRVWLGEFTFESRVLLQARGTCQKRATEQTALNDFVISRGIASRLIELEVRVDDQPLTRYRCDGLIVSSPTGSTAYSLAAGGAVVVPTAPVLQITPICPHTLSNRSLVVPLDARINIRAISKKPATILSADGQVVTELAPDDSLMITRSRRAVRLMHLAGSSFYDTLRRKLHWRGATVGPW